MFDRQGRRKYLNGSERQAFLKILQGTQDRTVHAFILTLFHTGCRISEALNLTLERIDLSSKCVVFETLKRRRQGEFRAVPIPDSLVALLDQLQPNTVPSALLWRFSRVTAYRMVKATMKRAGIEGGMACPKGLRHGFAIACIAQSIPLPTIQKWLGHAKLETTAIYLGVCGEEERNLARRLWSHLKTKPEGN